LEYFCALEILERFQTDRTLSPEQLKTEIFGHWADESWREVLCLLTGMIGPRFVAQALEYLLQQPDPQQTCHAIFLAARCVGEVRKRNDLGSIADELLDRVKALVRFDLNFFYETWDQDGARVAAIRTRAVSMVAVIWRDMPDTPAWLKRCATSDDDPNVRQAAVQELVRGWKEDPDTLPWLKERATSDSEGSLGRVLCKDTLPSTTNQQIEETCKGFSLSSGL
jgi:HEAT repeats